MFFEKDGVNPNIKNRAEVYTHKKAIFDRFFAQEMKIQIMMHINRKKE